MMHDWPVGSATEAVHRLSGVPSPKFHFHRMIGVSGGGGAEDRNEIGTLNVHFAASGTERHCGLLVMSIWAIVSALYAVAFVVQYAVLPYFDHRYRASLFPGEAMAHQPLMAFSPAAKRVFSIASPSGLGWWGRVPPGSECGRPRG